MNKPLLLLALLAFLALAGCLGGGPLDTPPSGLEEKVRAFPIVREAVAQAPDAALVVALWDDTTVEAVKRDLDTECRKTMPIKFYYRVQLKSQTVDTVLYLDPVSGDLECRSDKGTVKPALAPEYVPKDDQKLPVERPVEKKKYSLDVLDEAGQPIREVAVRLEKLVCDEKEVCIPRTVVDAKTDLVGQIKSLDEAVFPNSTLFAQGYHPLNSDSFRKVSGAYRAFLKRVVFDKDLLPLTVKFYDAETNGNFVGGTLYFKFAEGETGVFKQLSEEGAVQLTLEDFQAAGRRLVDEFGNLLIKQLIFELDGIEEVAVATVLPSKPGFMQTKEFAYGPFETIETLKEWNLRSKEISFRLHRALPAEASSEIFEYDFKSGKNYFSFPLQVVEGYSAEKFLNDLVKQNLECASLSVYEIQDWHTHTKGSVARNFFLENGVAYLLECATGGKYRMRGQHRYEPVDVPLNLGFNYVAATARTEGKPFSSIVTGCDTKGYQKIFPNGSPGTVPANNPLEINQIYIVVCEVGGTWDKRV